MSIRVLPDSVVNLISAGEVVERPASVVKELLENALDAGASEISVELEEGGRKSITVRDDGTGMDRHDLLLCVQRHATSKIAAERDLLGLSTLGFRGEALPSISAVTHFCITTSTGDEAWKLRMDGGVLIDVQPASRTRGTTVEAGSLFYNQPARRRFLRTRATELSWAERFVTGCSLARCDVSFSLSHNGSELFSLAGGRTVPDRLRNRYGLAAGIRHVFTEGGAGDARVSLVWFPDAVWNRKTHQYVLVNGRLVHSGLISSAIDEALAGPGGYPLVYCAVSLPPGLVDVNVHPAKREVRFREPSSVRDALRSALSSLPPERRASMHVQGPAASRSFGRHDRSAAGEHSGELFEAAMKVGEPSARQEGHAETGEFPIVQIGRAYLVTSTDRGIVLIDQHAAHERILFETVLESMRDASGSGRQRLLLPETVRMDAGERERLANFSEILNMSGFEFRFEGDTLVLTSVPQGTFHGIEALREILSALSGDDHRGMTVREKVAAAAACAGSVKFGDSLSSLESRQLVDRLFSTDDPFRCPHGRPTLIEISFDELEEKFGRK